MKTAFLYMAAFFGSISLYAQQNVPLNPADISPLLIGEQIPDVKLQNAQGEQVSLLRVVNQKPSVLVFYRGGWCPYCNAHLAELQTAEPEIIRTGYQIVAISPDAPENLAKSGSKHRLKYLLLSDSRAEAISAFGLAFQAPERYLETLQNYSRGENHTLMPVPAVFVVNKKGEILFEYINPNYKTRIKASLLLAVLKELNEDI
ncbi:MAG: peroxiredoxin [Cyclobacteriaceae bacterium]|nr:MAG: peroxiredoxin [Cyclobacteriaceae bacterium]